MQGLGNYWLTTMSIYVYIYMRVYGFPMALYIYIHYFLAAHLLVSRYSKILSDVRGSKNFKSPHSRPTFIYIYKYINIIYIQGHIYIYIYMNIYVYTMHIYHTIYL